MQWECTWSRRGRTFYTNEAGETVDASQGGVVVGDLPFPDQVEPTAQLEVQSEEPPSEQRAPSIGGRGKITSALGDSEETEPTGHDAKNSQSPRTTKTKNKLQSQRMARVRRLSQRNIKANMKLNSAPVSATSLAGTKSSLPTRTAALRSISRKRRARRNSMMSQITSIIDKDEHDPEAGVLISKTGHMLTQANKEPTDVNNVTSVVYERQITNQKMYCTRVFSERHCHV